MAGTGLAAVAFASDGTADVPAVAEPVIAALEAEGYVIEEVELEDGEIEIEAEKDGMEREITLAADTGAVMTDESEVDDDTGEVDDDANDNADDSPEEGADDADDTGADTD